MVNYIAFAVALALSAVAAYYSIIGLTTIFASAFIPIVVMGSTLEIAKLVAISWLYRNWDNAPRLIKYYLVTASVVLMFITSMGTFGYLSKAHMDQAVPTGSIQDKISIYDEKIRTEKENIDAARKALKQMDESVDQVLARSADEKGAANAAAMRRSQQKERASLVNDIAQAQARISTLQDERAPIANEMRKIVAEVGPIKYIAELVYEQADDAVLDKAVRWVIILIVAVFDPLAVVMLIAANQGLYGKREEDITKDPVVVSMKKSPPPEPFIDEMDYDEVIEPPSPKKERSRVPSWVKKSAELIQRRKKGILEIDENSVMKMK